MTWVSATCTIHSIICNEASFFQVAYNRWISLEKAIYPLNTGGMKVLKACKDMLSPYMWFLFPSLKITAKIKLDVLVHCQIFGTDLFGHCFNWSVGGVSMAVT